MKMTEAFLHHVWKLKLFNFKNLKTTDGESLEIIKTGLHNKDSGPDFFNAQLRIAGTLWAGNVEIHLKSSDWKIHAHEKDDAYDTVILHAVYELDEPVKRKDGSVIPTLELKGKFDHRLWKNYDELLESTHWIPCRQHIRTVGQFTLSNWLDRLLAERLERKTEAILVALRLNKNNWEETFYHHLAANFGFRLNALPFEMLAKSLPLAYLAKHKNHLNQVEAMLFGQAGMLEKEFIDEYPTELSKEYSFLKKKFGLVSIPLHQWKFLRLRPVNFPTIRIAQFAQLVHHSSHLFSKILDCERMHEMESYFGVNASAYWQAHYIFDKFSRLQVKHIGSSSVQNILVNTVVPFLFAYGKIRHSEMHQQRALEFLDQLPSERNSIISKWQELGIESSSAYRSQALLQLKNVYCAEKKCLTCSIGNKIISNLV
jgi:hypothetical protein